MTSLVRIRFPLDVLERLDALAREIGTLLARRVPRAAIIRAMVALCSDTTAPELVTALDIDTVRRGRAKGARMAGRRPS